MKMQANNIKAGMIIEHNGQNWKVLKAQTIKPGKGGAFLQAEIRNITTGNKSNHRWRTNDKITKLDSRQSKSTFLYQSGDDYIFMDAKTFEQITINANIVGEDAIFLTENIEIEICFVNHEPVSIILPSTVQVTVEECDPPIKGKNSNKIGKLSNGLSVTIPQYIDRGVDIIINPVEMIYIEKCKEKNE